MQFVPSLAALAWLRMFLGKPLSKDLFGDLERARIVGAHTHSPKNCEVTWREADQMAIGRTANLESSPLAHALREGCYHLAPSQHIEFRHEA